MPAERVAVMRTAMAETFKDADFLADANRMLLGVGMPKSGVDVQKLIEDAYHSPPEVIDRLRKLSLH